jgi:hypothetical protein
MKENAPGINPVGMGTPQVTSKAGHFNKWVYETHRPVLKSQIHGNRDGIRNISNLIIYDSIYFPAPDNNKQYFKFLEFTFQDNKWGNYVAEPGLQYSNSANTYAAFKSRLNIIHQINVTKHYDGSRLKLLKRKITGQGVVRAFKQLKEFLGLQEILSLG